LSGVQSMGPPCNDRAGIEWIGSNIVRLTMR
jgi:hypothetical protein